MRRNRNFSISSILKKIYCAYSYSVGKVQFGVDRREASLIHVLSRSGAPLALQHALFGYSDKAAQLIAGPRSCLAIIPVYCNDPLTNNLIKLRLCPLTCFGHSVSQPGGDEGTRTPDIRLAKAALSQLSYIPVYIFWGVGLTGFEPVTPALSAQCSNQLSYRPGFVRP
jgi:hypothetical protein